MKQIFRAIRFSAIGAFFTGIITVIQGCSIEREGALFAFLLFLLSFCTGPTKDAPVVVDPLVFDAFTALQTHTAACNNNSASAAVNDASFSFNDRVMEDMDGMFTTPTMMIERTIGGGLFQARRTEIVAFECRFTNRAMLTWSGGSVDLSPYTKVQVDVRALAQQVNECRIRLTPSGGMAVTTAEFDITSTGIIEVDISGINPRNNVTQVEFGENCEFVSFADVTFGPLVFIP